MINPDEVVFDTDIDEVSPWVECEWGHAGCTGGDYATEMVSCDGGWMCPTCERVALSEYEDYKYAAMYDGAQVGLGW